MAPPSPAKVSSPSFPRAWAGTDLDVYRSNFASFRREIRRLLVSRGLLLSDFRALHCIRERAMHPTALAERLDLTPAAATQLVDRLEGQKLVRRFPDAQDRRAKVVRLTPAGARSYERTSRLVGAFVGEVASRMSPEGLEALRRGSEELARVLANRTPA